MRGNGSKGCQPVASVAPDGAGAGAGAEATSCSGNAMAWEAGGCARRGEAHPTRSSQAIVPLHLRDLPCERIGIKIPSSRGPFEPGGVRCLLGEVTQWVVV